LSVPAVKSRLLRARLQLRDRLGRYFQRREPGNGKTGPRSGDVKTDVASGDGDL
jgi:RNA polymerase sigma-70 factor, ECF subfamily